MKSYLYNQFVKVGIIRSLLSSCNKTFKSRITTTDSQKNFYFLMSTINPKN